MNKRRVCIFWELLSTHTHTHPDWLEDKFPLTNMNKLYVCMSINFHRGVKWRTIGLMMINLLLSPVHSSKEVVWLINSWWEWSVWGTIFTFIFICIYGTYINIFFSLTKGDDDRWWIYEIFFMYFLFFN